MSKAKVTKTAPLAKRHEVIDVGPVRPTSRSDRHTRAEPQMILGFVKSIEAASHETQVVVASGAKIDVIAVLSDGTRVAAEVYARIGKPQGGQIKKTTDDAMKLLGVRRRGEADRLALVVSPEVAACITGWRRAELQAQQIEIVPVELIGDHRVRLLEEQAANSAAIVAVGG